MENNVNALCIVGCKYMRIYTRYWVLLGILQSVSSKMHHKIQLAMMLCSSERENVDSPGIKPLSPSMVISYFLSLPVGIVGIPASP